MGIEFGQQVLQQAQALARQGRDANQIAKLLFDNDKQGYNYGIGIILGGDGQPLRTSPTVLEYTQRELTGSDQGTYMTSQALAEALKHAVLRWQRIPEPLWDRFKLALPSDAGTGAVQMAVHVALTLYPEKTTLGVEELGWPAYQAMAKTARLDFKTHPVGSIIRDTKTLALYQAGPMNTTGRVHDLATIQARARLAAEAGECVVLDRAYAGFEFAHLLGTASYDEVMSRSFERQIAPFVEAQVPFLLALSPTKAFVTFSLRPAGLLLAYAPDPAQDEKIGSVLNMVVRARGSSFEHAVTRAFARALVEDLGRMEAEHKAAMGRVAEAERRWRTLSAGSGIAYLFTEHYAGLFRNPPAGADAAVHVYGEHLYPVFSGEHCRLNVTGIPDDDALAHRHVQVFAAHCH